jgi:hypothetical protein
MAKTMYPFRAKQFEKFRHSLLRTVEKKCAKTGPFRFSSRSANTAPAKKVKYVQVFLLLFIHFSFIFINLSQQLLIRVNNSFAFHPQF